MAAGEGPDMAEAHLQVYQDDLGISKEAMTNEEKREVLKRWYADKGHSMIQMIRDCQEVQRIHGYARMLDAIGHLYDEMEALGTIKPVDEGKD